MENNEVAGSTSAKPENRTRAGRLAPLACANSCSASVGVNDCWSSLAVMTGLNLGYAVRSIDGKILLHA
jgi:hypothetical protein